MSSENEKNFQKSVKFFNGYIEKSLKFSDKAAYALSLYGFCLTKTRILYIIFTIIKKIERAI